MTRRSTKVPVKTVKVGPHVYKVEAHKNLSNMADADGACIQGSALIVYDPGQVETMARDTILHELLHAIWTQTTLDNIHDDKVEEQVCWSLAPGLLNMLRENPDLVEWLVKQP